MANKLVLSNITAVALCKQGMNPVADIVLYKSIDKGVTSMNFEEVLKGLPADQQKIIVDYLAKALPPVTGCPQCTALGHLCPACQAKQATAAKKAVIDSVTKAVQNPDEGIKSQDADIAAVATIVKATADALVEAQKASGKTSATDEDLLKSLPEGIRKMFEATQQRAEAAEKISKELKEQQLTAQYTGIAKAMDKLPASDQDLGAVLKAIAVGLPDVYPKVETLLTAANKAIAEGALFTEVGKGDKGLGGGKALDQLNNLAKAIVVADPTTTVEKAFMKACTDNPKLYTQYTNEMEGNN